MVAHPTAVAGIGTIPSERRHATPLAADRCDLWATLRTRDSGAASLIGLTRSAQPLFLHFRASGLLLALPDEKPSMLDQGWDAVTIALRTTDALGLGLLPADLEAGTGICGADGNGPLDGWRCRDVVLVGVDERGRESPLTGPAAFAAWLA